MAEIFPKQIADLRELLGLTQAQMGEKLGVTAKYVGMLERGEKEVGERTSIGLLFRLLEADAAGRSKPAAALRILRGGENPERSGFSGSDGLRRIRVIGWAHAGQAAGYEEIPEDWQETVPTDCRDPQAFGVTLEGDSMEPMFREGDLLVLMPSERIHNGCLAVLRLASDGVLLRRVEVRGERIRMVPMNPRYDAEEVEGEKVSWAYPVWGAWRQCWK